jgi:hypothetical protein
MSSQPQFAVCVDNKGYPAALEPWKIYRALPDQKAGRHNLVRIIDESGEDYLYPAGYFVPIRLPSAARQALLDTTQ